jgi:amino acid adenylation domain-containing protein
MSARLVFRRDNPVLQNHRAYGRELMPGLTYIDIVLQHFRDTGVDPKTLSLRNLALYRALTVPAEGTLEARILATRTDFGWRCEIVGPDDQRFITVDVVAGEPAQFTDRIDPSSLGEPGRQPVPIESIYANCRAADMVHEGFMKASGTLYPGEDAFIADIRIPECARAAAPHFLFHPTLLDAGSLATGMAFADRVGEAEPLFLPLSCGVFRWSAPLREAGYARVRRSSVRRQGMLLIRDLEFFDSTGRKVAEIEKFVCTMVRDPAHLGARQVVAEATGGGDDRVMAALRLLLAEYLPIPAEEISEEAGFYEIGLDSTALLAIADRLGTRLGRSLPPTLMFEYTNLSALADHLRADWVDGPQAPPSPKREPTRQPMARSTAAPAGAEPIAIIGLAGRYPGAADLGEFWDNLCQGRDSVTEIPASRWDHRDHAHLRSRTGRPISRWGGFIDAPDAFDARFFRISPREAEMMDPQERQFMQVCWAALEDAGYTPETVAPEHGAQKRRNVGVFAGVMHKDYALVVAEAQDPAAPLPLSLNYAQIANRVSFFCGFHGPSLTVDTVCSSSLVAVHLAIESLRRGETDVCLAGGVNLSLHPAKYVTYGQGNLFSTDGRCRAFGEGGDGYVPAEGVGAVVLKPLSKALLDRDPVYAVIRGSAVNHVGHVSGVTVPSPTAQAELVQQALHQAGIDARTIDMIEAHGTGTALGDPIEIEGLTQAFRAHTNDRQFCAIASVKSNIGHAEAAAGVSGLTKLALQLHHRRFVPSLHAGRTNSKIDFAASPFFVQRALAPWPEPADGRPRRGGVSSFGATGTNAHLVLEGFDDPSPATPVNRESGCVLPLSAQTEAQLRRHAGRILAFLQANADTSLADLAYTMQVGRKAFEHRAVFDATDRATLLADLARFAQGGACPAPAAAIPAMALAAAWLRGEVCDWSTLYRGRQVPRRLHAPGYPFATDRYWAPIARPADAAVLLARPSWAVVPNGTSAPVVDRVVVPILPSMAKPVWQAEPEAAGIHWLDVPGETFEDLATALFGLIKQHAGGRQRWQIVVDDKAADGLADALCGLSRTAQQEIPTLALQLIVAETSTFATGGRFREAIATAATRPDCPVLRYQAGKLSARAWDDLPASAPAAPWKDRGVYLISGGLGGLGLLFARDIAEKASAPVIVLVGRSPIDAAHRARLAALEAAGARATYVPVDITDPAAVASLVAHIREAHGKLDGVIHSAGLLSDALIRNKTEAAFRAVLAPKIAGTRILDTATADLDLDFFVLFSSGAGIFGNPGQADYATANAWQGAFAQQRHERARTGDRRGRTLAVHWPLWADGGMRPNAETERLWEERTGLRPLSTPAGLAAFYQALGTDSAEILVLAGKRESLKQHFGIGQGIAAPQAPAEAPAPERASAEPATTALPETLPAVLARVKQILGDIIKLAPDSIRSDDRLENFGLDSVMVVQFSQRLAGLSSDIPATLLYEFSDLRSLAQHLVDRYPAACVRWCGVAPVSVSVPAEPPPPAAPALARAPRTSSAMDLDQPIAIIGLAGRYPKAPDLDALWDNLLAGRDCIGEVPADRWSLRDFYEPDRRAAVEAGKSYSKWGGFLEGFADFDPLFFQISPMEAAAIDPQERLFIETAWQAFEDAGYSREEIQRRHGGRVGVFAGITRTGFNLYALERWKAGDKMLPGTSFSSVANRISYLMNLRGPSMPIDTMCSSSLTAIHEACAHLLRDECDMALAGGVNLYLHPLNYVSASAQQMLSPDGRCKTFGLGANGFVPGEGVGAVLLKKLSDAEREGDHISAVIRSTAVNHNGRTNGYTVPNPNAQRELIQAALAKASIDPRTVTLLEAHGTGTELGDPIEIQGLQEALQAREAGRMPCAVGSIKSNIGHLEAAAGIAGLTKAVLQLRHRKIVPSLHAGEPNPKIDFANSALFVPQAPADWLTVERDGLPAPRRAGVSSFGAGGANAHVVLEEYLPSSAPLPVAAGSVLVILSARTLPALEAQASALLAHIGTHAPDLESIAFTLQVGREAFAERLAIVAASSSELEEALRAFIGGRPCEAIVHRGNLRDAPAAFEVLRDDPDMDALVAAWARQGRVAKIATFWGQGFPIDWRQLYAGRTPRRIGLPTVQFDRQRFWIESADLGVRPSPEAAAADLDDLMFKPVWQRPASLKRVDADATRSTVILYARSSEALATALAKALPQSHHLALAEPAGLVEQILAIEPAIGRLVLVADAPDAREPQPVEAIGLALLQGLAGSGLALSGLALCLVTQNATDRAPSHGAGLHGLGQAWAQSGIPVAVCDIDAADATHAEGIAGIVDLVARLAPEPRGGVVRFRHGACFSRQLVPLDASRKAFAPPIRQGGRYVIVGGAGLVGQIVSRHLIEQYRADIVWIGRTPPTSPDLQAKLESFAASGAAPFYLQADATDLSSLQEAVAQIGDVAGVFFAAMDFAFGDPLIVTRPDFERALATKQAGAWNCFEAFRDRELDFLCSFSSIQAYDFSNSQNSTAYAAGISAGDAAVRQAAAGARFPVGIIHWGFWRAAIAGTVLERNSGALDAPEALRCLETGLSLLRAGQLDDVVCMRLPTGATRAYVPLAGGTLHQVLSSTPLNPGAEPAASAPAYIDDKTEARFRDLATQVLFATLADMGCFRGGDLASVETMLRRAGIAERYRGWLEEAVAVLQSSGLLTGTIQPDTTTALAAWNDFERQAGGDPALRSMVALLGRCLTRLPEILRGDVPATDIVFPKGDIAGLGQVYEGNAWSDFFNGRVADAVTGTVAQLLRAEPDRVVRIVEIGAGTGGTTRTVLDRLGAYASRLHYLYTDVSPAFLRHGRDAFAAKAPFVEFQRWNVDESPDAHRIEEGGYDIAIATNVLHATSDIRRTLRNVKASLRNGGMLVLNETVHKTLFGTLTFGLLEGWWAFSDAPLRIAGAPLLSPAQWLSVLEEGGFAAARFLTEPTRAAAQLVIASQSDGWIHRAVEVPAIVAGPPPLAASVDPGVAPDALRDVVLECLSKALNITADRIDARAPFSDYGVDSIVGTQVVTLIGKRLGVRLNAAVLYEHTSVERLAAHLIRTLPSVPVRAPIELPQAVPAKPQPVFAAPPAEPRSSPARSESIAVIGMALQAPGAPDVDAFWRVLTGEAEVPADRRLNRGAAFDPLFFRISPREADGMSRHQQLVLMESWKALEDAAIAPSTLSGKAASLYVGAEPTGQGSASFTGASDAIIASRLAYFLDLRGAALVVNTGCSSSATALHLACEALRHGETDLALAGGVFANLQPDIVAELTRIGMVSPSGRCLTFDADADGTVLCEGVGMVVLKRLDDAIAAGDPIRGVIVASGTNQDGASNGITAPNGLAQEELIASVYRRGKISPDAVSYIEAHGTGTALGDPVEANALIRAFASFTARRSFCRIGSAKSVIGHASAAAGVIGLIKILLCLEKRVLPGLANFTRLNPLIDLAQSPFAIETTAQAWDERPGQPLTAGLSSFGHSGTNVHLVVQSHEAPSADVSGSPLEMHAVPVSARTPAQVRASIGKLRAFLQTAAGPASRDSSGPIRDALARLLGVDGQIIELDEPLDDLGVEPQHRVRLQQDLLEQTGTDVSLLEARTLRDVAMLARRGSADAVSLADLAFTLQQGRDHRETRTVFFARGIDDLLAQFDRYLSDDKAEAAVPVDAPAPLVALAQRWLKGEDKVWPLPALGRRPHRLHLPSSAFAGGTYATPVGTPSVTVSPSTAPTLFAPVWEAVPVVPMALDQAALDRLRVIANPDDPRRQRILEAHPGVASFAHGDDFPPNAVSAGDHLCWLAPQHQPLDPDESSPVVALLAFVQQVLSQGTAHLPLEWTIVTCRGQATHAAEPVDPHQAAVHGLAGTMAKEYPAWRFRVVDMAASEAAFAGNGFAQMLGLKPDRRGRPWVSRTVDDDGSSVRLQWRQQRLVPLLAEEDPATVYRKGGVYIAIGGAGDIGGVWSEHVIWSVGAQVIWVGRRPEDETIRAKIDRLAALGPRPLYLCADATDGDALAGVRDAVKRRFGRIDGVIHSALVFFEKGLAELDTATFLTGFRAKAASCTALARVFADEELGFVALFSSVVAQIKNPRQGAYAAGCAFADALAHELDRQWRCPVKTVNWGYWSSTKEQVADESAYRAFMRLAEIGVGLIEPAEGMRALDCLLAGPLQQIGIVKTTRQVEIEGLDRTQTLRLPLAPLPAVPDLVALPTNVAELQARGEIAGLDALMLPLLQAQLTAARGQGAAGTYLDAWRQESLAWLGRQGSAAPVDAAAAWRSWQDHRAVWDADPAKRAQAELVEATLRALPDILSGRRKPTDVMFPQGSMHLVEAVHRNNPVADHFQKTMAALVVANLRAAAQPVRILEIGAGTGGTTSAVLQALDDPANRGAAAGLVDYTYTDVSKAFLQHGEQAFGRTHRVLRFQLLDIERPPSEQGIDVGAYDLVIAGNVLHATRDIRRTLQHAKSLLRPGGILLACEVSLNALFTHLTFGLLEGWWLSEDPVLRMPGNPGLTPRAWQTILHEEGFPRVDFPLADAHALGQQIILAHSDGVTRVKGSVSPVAAITAPVVEPKGQKLVSIRQDGALALFREIVGAVLKMPAAEIDPEAPLDRYGMDSILAVTLAEDLNRHFEGVSSTLVFEHQTVAAIAAHFVQTQSGIVARLLAERGAPPAEVPAAPAARAEHPAPPPRSERRPDVANDDRIAVIGMSGRFPGADTVDALWALLREGRSALGDMPAERWDQHQRDLFRGDAAQFHTRGGYAADIQCFDPVFFGISPREARWIDPRQRLFLEEAWHAFEDAGRMGESLRGSNCGVYVGVEEGEYGFLTKGQGQISSNQIASLAARIAYFLDLHGPNFALSAACSSGLVAIHQACQALRSGECDMALAGGVSLLVSPVVHLGLAHSKMLSTSGECRVFDPASSGMVPADGVAAVVLKRLDDAIRDGDRIHGCIRASGVNYDGKTMGLAAPNPRSQSSLIDAVYQRAGLSADTIQLVLAHSVGSALTDAVEVQALSEAYARQGAATAACTLSSIKPLVGHSFAASGVVSLIAMLLAMKHETMPGTHGFAEAHPNIRLDGGPFIIRADNRAWPRPAGDVRRGAIGTTGLSGTNAHAVVEEYVPSTRAAPSSEGPQIFVFSARTGDQLDLVLARFVGALDSLRDTPLCDIAYTLQVGREPLAQRLAFVARDWQDLRATAEACRRVLDRGHRGDTAKAAGALTALFSGPAGATFVTSLVESRDLDRLALLWTQGCQIPWRRLQGPVEPGRVGLPGYPFARERYWATDAEDSPVVAVAAPVVEPAKPGLANAIRHFLAGQLDMAPDALPGETPWRDYGVDSIVETRLMLMLEETLGFSMTGRELVDHPSIAALSRHLAACTTDAKAESPPVEVPPLSDGKLSEGQQGLWMLDQLHPGGAARNIPIAFEIPGPWDPAAFAEAIAALSREVPLLRVLVFEQEGEPQLATTPTLDYQTALRPDLAGDALIGFLRTEAQRPFDLAAGPLMRTRVWSGQDGRDLVLIVFHHLVFDGASAVVFFKALWAAYDAIAQGRDVPALAQGAPYVDFVAWEQDMLRGPQGQVLRDYWREQLSGAPLPAPLASDRAALSPDRTQAGQTHRHRLDPALAARLRDLGRARGIRDSVLFLALYQALIARLACSDDPVIGLVAQVRPQSRFENTIGYFVNTLPIRRKIDPDLPFLAQATRLQDGMLEALDHAAYPLPVLVRELSPGDQRGGVPVFQSVFAFQNFVPKRLKDDRNTYSSVLPVVPIAEITAEGDDELALEVLEESDSVTLLFKYAPDLWNEATIASLARSFVAMAQALVDGPDRPWREIRPVSPPSTWIAGSPADPTAPDIAASVEASARRTPQALAVVLAGDVPTAIDYRSLDARANRLTRLLTASCPDRTRPIGVCLRRSIDSVVVLLGLLKSGLVYLPLDPHDTPQRLATMVAEAEPECLIVDDETAPLFTGTARVLRLEDCLSRAAAHPDQDPAIAIDAAAPAYIIFTSGSTGTPKGVVVERRSLSAHCHEMARRLGCKGTDRLLQFTPLHLDPSLEQILVGLSAGATVVLRDEEFWTAGQFWDRVRAHDISIVDVTASYLRELLIGAPGVVPPSLRTVIVGGEAFPIDLYRQWQDSPLSRIALINAYGPTEATVTSALFEVPSVALAPGSVRTVPIGRPLAGEEIVILDDWQQPAAEGFPGELYIGGSGVARGYLQRAELTRERFGAPPPAVQEKVSAQRFFRTGDLGRYIPGTDGLIECLGRRDRLVKVRGVRIELDEVASAIRAFPSIADCVVRVELDAQGDGQLSAIVRFAPGADPSGALQRLRSFLEQRLPRAMIPSRLAPADGAAVPMDQVESPPPTDDDRVTAMTRLWEELLQAKGILPDSGFFHLGGHSLLAIRLLHRIEQQFGTRIALSAFLRNPTIEAVCRELDGAGPERIEAAVAASGSPLFFVHGGDGPFLGEPEFAAAVAPASFHVLAPLAEDRQQDPVSLEMLAARCVDDILERQPEGPYRLCGWSFGGLLAFEIAAQLRALGRDIALLVLLDGYTPQYLADLEASVGADASPIAEFAQSLFAISGIDLTASAGTTEPIQAAEILIARARETGQIQSDAEAAYILRNWRSFARQVDAMSRYVPPSYAGDLLLVRAQEELDRPVSVQDTRAGWDACCTGQIDVLTAAGDHYSMMQPPLVGRIIAAVADRLRRET